VRLVKRVVLRRENVAVRPEVSFLLVRVEPNPHVVGLPDVHTLRMRPVWVGSQQDVHTGSRNLITSSSGRIIGAWKGEERACPVHALDEPQSLRVAVDQKDADRDSTNRLGGHASSIPPLGTHSVCWVAADD
jgi:hypothetical protein